jgi:hypothetical protein
MVFSQTNWYSRTVRWHNSIISVLYFDTWGKKKWHILCLRNSQPATGRTRFELLTKLERICEQLERFISRGNSVYCWKDRNWRLRENIRTNKIILSQDLLPVSSLSLQNLSSFDLPHQTISLKMSPQMHHQYVYDSAKILNETYRNVAKKTECATCHSVGVYVLLVLATYGRICLFNWRPCFFFSPTPTQASQCHPTWPMLTVHD